MPESEIRPKIVRESETVSESEPESETKPESETQTKAHNYVCTNASTTKA